jgi:hypothetical protein
VDNKILGSRFIRTLETLGVSLVHFKSTKIVVGAPFENTKSKLKWSSQYLKLRRAGSPYRVLHPHFNTDNYLCSHFPFGMCDAKRS